MNPRETWRNAARAFLHAITFDLPPAEELPPEGRAAAHIVEAGCGLLSMMSAGVEPRDRVAEAAGSALATLRLVYREAAACDSTRYGPAVAALESLLEGDGAE